MRMAPSPLALVTGAAHRLGKVFAVVLARQGYAVCVHYWNSQAQAEETARELRALGASVFLLQANLADADAIPQLFARLDAFDHPLHVLVNSAGHFGGASGRGLPLAEWDLTMDLNLRAPFLCAREAAARMARGGLIVNITDVGARKSWSRFPAYVASKAGLEALTRVLARTYAPGIRVNAIAPGLILPSQQTSESDWERLTARLPMKRPGTTEEVGAALEFLLHNAYITGQTLVVDGGYSLVA